MALVGNLYSVSAPSGAGKTSLVKAVARTMSDNVKLSVSHTTRAQRPGEVNGIDYHFVDTPTFESLIQQDAFVEHAEVFGSHYGTEKAWLQTQLESGYDVILEIDWQGAQIVKQHFPESIGIFILPPSREALQSRLQTRAQDSADVIQNRMNLAQKEMQHYAEYDYLIINDEFRNALSDLETILRGQRLARETQAIQHEKLIQDLLAESP